MSKQAPLQTEHHEAGTKALAATTDVERIEAPVTMKAYATCAIAAFGGIFFGYDSGYINGVTGAAYFIRLVQGQDATSLSSRNSSLIVSILSLGTFFGALIAGDVADRIGRRPTIIIGCFLYLIGVALQTASHGLNLLVGGRVVAGLGAGFESAIVVLYMSEISPRKVRGALVSCYQWAITFGLLIASCVNYATKDRNDTGSYRIPIVIQFAWGIILALGLFWLPESPRFFIMRGQVERARAVLVRLRGQPAESEFIEMELSELVAYQEFENQHNTAHNWFESYAQCFKGSLWDGSSNLRRVILGTSCQMMQQWTGVNFIFYYSTPFLASTGAISNTFLISIIFTLVNVLSTPLSFWIIERFGRRTILLYGAICMVLCQFLVAIVGVTVGFNHTHAEVVDGVSKTLADNKNAVNAQIAFICFFIFFFAMTWGPGAWVLIGEIFPVGIRSRGVALSTASNWMWNTIIAVITPYMVNEDKGNLKSNVFWIWMGLCICAVVWTYFLVPETKGLSLEQVDRMLAESTPRKSSAWRAHATYVETVTGGAPGGHLNISGGHIVPGEKSHTDATSPISPTSPMDRKADEAGHE